MPNIFAYVAIIVWPLLVIFFFSKYPIRKAILLSMFGSFMFLPVGLEINFPGIPAFNKFTVTSMILIFAIGILKRKPIGFRSLRKPHKYIFLLLLIAPFITVLSNREPYMFLPGLSLYDSASWSMGLFLLFFPFLIGYHYFRTYDDQLYLFKFFVIAALIYGLLAAYEIRMSPQLHTDIYGYFPHEWQQQVREGGFRPVLFMGHGLMVSLFLALGIIIVNALRMCKVQFTPFNNTIILLMLVVILVLSKSLSALIITLSGLIFAIIFSYKKIHYVSFFIVFVFLSYPITTSVKIFPHQTLVDYASLVSVERAQSLGFRFHHEEQLLNHANQKPIFGWGIWGRNRIYDPETGRDLSITDGKWLLTLGTQGWVGFITQFYFLIIGIFIAYKASRNYKGMSQKEGVLLSSHVLIVAFVLLDQMPNASFNPFYVFISGCLLGRSEQLMLERQTANQVYTSETL